MHIVSFDIPFPPDYGGVIDVYYKLKALHAEGIKIILHCFAYGRSPSDELEKFCERVYYYPRHTTKSLLFNTLPYIVLSRESESLKANLLEDDSPILMEGLHSTFLLSSPELSDRNKIVRTHNVEHDYYENLARVERNIFKKYYFYNEAGKLKKYESVLKKANAIAAIAPNDVDYYSNLFSTVSYLPAFHPFDDVSIAPGKSDFAFYHGNLSVGENNEAALFLVNSVFTNAKHKLIIAGSKPSAELIKAVRSNPAVKLLSDQTPGQIYDLVKNAQCNILPTFQSTGIKLKLLAALFTGRTCIVNTPMVQGTGLSDLCIIADTADQMIQKLDEVMIKEECNENELATRKSILGKDFSNKANAQKLIMLLS
ncbi:MAG: glycosyltransferase [Bacteroidia bacterium]|nr:glycosyltransferase [Bacteroidia bacterium]